MVELVDTTDLKSVDPKGRAGSSPAPGTTIKSRESGFFLVPKIKRARTYCFFRTLVNSKEVIRPISLASTQSIGTFIK